MPSWLLTLIAPWIAKALGLQVAQVTNLLPLIVSGIGQVKSLIDLAKAHGIDIPGALKALITMLPKPHEMTPEEQKAFAERLSNVGEGGGG